MHTQKALLLMVVVTFCSTNGDVTTQGAKLRTQIAKSIPQSIARSFSRMGWFPLDFGSLIPKAYDSPKFSCPGEGFYTNPLDCTKFFRCMRFVNIYYYYSFMCAPGTVFSKKIGTCVRGSCLPASSPQPPPSTQTSTQPPPTQPPPTQPPPTQPPPTQPIPTQPSPTTSPPADCVTLIEGSGICYEFVMIGNLNWDQARNNCQNRGGDLASLDTSEKQIKMANYFRNNASDLIRGVWIGGHLPADSSTWSWVNGKPVTGGWNMDSGEPIKTQAGESCMHNPMSMLDPGESDLLFTISCTFSYEALFPLCQKEIVSGNKLFKSENTRSHRVPLQNTKLTRKDYY